MQTTAGKFYSDACDTAAGAALHQIVKGALEPLGFFSRKFDKTQLRDSTYDRELTAIYLAMRHFKFMLEGRVCHVFTDHKPITLAFRQNLDKASDRQARQLDFISQITTDIRHVEGRDNVTADLLSSISALNVSQIDFRKMAEDGDAELQRLIHDPSKSSLKLKLFTIPGSSKQLYFR